MLVADLYGSGVKILAALLLPGLAFAQPTCAPSQIGGSGGPAHFGASANGYWVWWWCPGEPYPNRIIARKDNATLRQIGDRTDTIKDATDKGRALENAWKRYVTLPYSDPLLAAVRADFEAHIKATPNLGK